MIAPQDISALLSIPATGVSRVLDPTGAVNCTWTNTATEESVVLTIRSPGTAPNNVLPAPDPVVADMMTPGPDGMRYTGDRAVEFAAGNRINQVQVAVLRISEDDANAAAVRLAHEVAPQVPQ